MTTRAADLFRAVIATAVLGGCAEAPVQQEAYARYGFVKAAPEELRLRPIP